MQRGLVRVRSSASRTIGGSGASPRRRYDRRPLWYGRPSPHPRVAGYALTRLACSFQPIVRRPLIQPPRAECQTERLAVFVFSEPGTLLIGLIGVSIKENWAIFGPLANLTAFAAGPCGAAESTASRLPSNPNMFEQASGAMFENVFDHRQHLRANRTPPIGCPDVRMIHPFRLFRCAKLIRRGSRWPIM